MDQVAEVKSKVDIVEVVSSYLPLKKTGRNFAALCPFHSEKTPSLMVSPERQVYKCFGCQEAGDVFTFLEKIEGWDFREALEELAKKVGVKLESFVPSEASQAKQKLIEINALAAKFYSHLLNQLPIGQAARKYLEERKIPKSLREKFGLGYAPASWENILRFLSKRGFSTADIAMSGLIVAREGGFYDRFRDRLIFPLKDSKGVVLGFAGRIIESSFAKASEGRQETHLRQGFGGQARSEPKYINSPETPIFNKGSVLFGLDLAKNAIREKNEVVLVEGEFDLLSAYKAGIVNVVASKGTALTDKQVAILGRFCEVVKLCFDADIAGDQAVRRGIELLDISGVTVKVVRLGGYKDPDEFIRKDPSAFKKATSAAVNVYDYYLESARRRFDPKSADGKKKIGRELLPTLAKISDDLVRAHYIDKLAKLLDLEVNLVSQAVEKRITDLTVYTKESSTPAQSQSRPVVPVEEYFLAIFLSQDEVAYSLTPQLLPSDFENRDAKQLWQWFGDIIKSPKSPSLKKLLTKLPVELKTFVDNLYLINISPAFFEKELWGEELSKVAKRIKRDSLKRQLSAISEQLKQAQEKADNLKVASLSRKFDKITGYLEEISRRG